MNGMTQKELLQLDAMADRLRQRIRTAPDRLTIGGTVYYVAADGCDDSDLVVDFQGIGFAGKSLCRAALAR